MIRPSPKPVFPDPRTGSAPTALLLALALTILLVAPTAGADRFEIVAGYKANVVRFDSKAPVESFGGATHQVRGYLEVVPGALGDSITVAVEVDLASLDTGIGLRNEHMRKNHLETDRYPKARFVGGAIRTPHPTTLAPDTAIALTVEGNFELHGVTRRLKMSIEVTYAAREASPAVHVVGRFPVALSDFSIQRPQFLLMRLGEVQQVTVDVKALLAR